MVLPSDESIHFVLEVQLARQRRLSITKHSTCSSLGRSLLDPTVKFISSRFAPSTNSSLLSSQQSTSFYFSIITTPLSSHLLRLPSPPLSSPLPSNPLPQRKQNSKENRNSHAHAHTHPASANDPHSSVHYLSGTSHTPYQYSRHSTSPSWPESPACCPRRRCPRWLAARWSSLGCVAIVDVSGRFRRRGRGGGRDGVVSKSKSNLQCICIGPTSSPGQVQLRPRIFKS